MHQRKLPNSSGTVIRALAAYEGECVEKHVTNPSWSSISHSPDLPAAADRGCGKFQMALAARRPGPAQLIHHSDRGVQYACAEYSALLAAHGIQPSMSRI